MPKADIRQLKILEQRLLFRDQVHRTAPDQRREDRGLARVDAGPHARPLRRQTGLRRRECDFLRRCDVADNSGPLKSLA